MSVRLRKTSQSLMRTGLALAATGALLFNPHIAPAYAADTSTGSTTAIVVPVPSTDHPQAAQNVVVTVEGNQVNVSWQRPATFRGEFRVSLMEGRQTLIARNVRATTVEFGPDQVKAGHTYYIAIHALDNWGIDPLPGSGVLSDSFTIAQSPSTDPATPPDNNTTAPDDEGSTPENGSDTDSETTPSVQAPSIPKNLTIRLLSGDTTAVEAFWFEPTDGGPITGYEANLVGSDDTSRLATVDMSAPLPEYWKFTDLTPGVSYQIQVRAQNAGGWGEWSPLSDPVLIPADQEAFKMQIDESGFGAFVHPNGHVATVSWAPTGNEPEHAVYLIRIECVKACGANFKSHIKQYYAHDDLTNWKIENLPAGVYHAQIKLINGNQSSQTLTSDAFTIGNPTEIADPQLVVSPTTDIDPAKPTTFTVTGTGYLGDGATLGVYVVIADTSAWTPGTTPDVNRIKDYKFYTHVPASHIVNGQFSSTFDVSAHTFEPGKQYFVATMAAHALSVVDRSLDQRVDLTLKEEVAPQPEQPDVVDPDPEPDTGDTTPDTPNTGDTTPDTPNTGDTTPDTPNTGDTTPDTPNTGDTTPDTPNTGDTTPDTPNTGDTTPDTPNTGDTTPDKPETESPESGDSENPAVSVEAFENGKPVNSFIHGTPTVVEFVFSNAREGSTWKVELRSDPISLGTVTVKDGRAKLTISAETAAKFVAGMHSLEFSEVGVDNPASFKLPWVVKAAKTITPGVQTNHKDGKHNEKSTTDKNAEQTNTTKADNTKDMATTPSSTLARTGVETIALALLSLTLVVAGVAARSSRKFHS